MKKTIGIILIVIVCLNFISILTRVSNGQPGTYPLHIIGLVLMLIGGIALINSANKNKSKTSEIGNIKKQTDDE